MKGTMLVRQRDQKDCGAACLASVCAYYGKKASVVSIRMIACTGNDGTSIAGLQYAASALGFDTKAVRTIPALLERIHLPAIAHIRLGELLHFVVLVKITTTSVTVMDPAIGALVRMKRMDFCRAWTGAAVMMVPFAGFVPFKGQSTIIRLLKISATEWSRLLICFLLALMVSITGLLPALAVRWLIDDIVPTGDLVLLHVAGSIMILALISETFLHTIKGVLTPGIARRVMWGLAIRCYERLHHLPASFFETMAAGEILSRISDTFRIGSFAANQVVDIFLNAATVLATLIALYFLDWRIAMLVTLALPLFAWIFCSADSYNRRAQRNALIASAAMDAKMTGLIGGYRTVRQLQAGHFVEARARMHLADFLRQLYVAQKGAVLRQAPGLFLSRIVGIACLWFGCLSVTRGALTMGELLSCYAIIGYFSWSLSNLLALSQEAREAVVAGERVFEMLDLDNDGDGNITPLWKKVKRIIVRDLGFAYMPGTKLLSALSMTFTAGRLSGISGKSGAGKSTIAALLQRERRPQSGTIIFNDVDLQDIRRDCLEKIITVVPQAAELLDDSIDETSPRERTILTANASTN